MPLYEYLCQGCGTRFEVLQRVGASASGTVCPKCGGLELAKQYSTFASATAGPGGSGSLAAGFSSASSCGSGGFS